MKILDRYILKQFIQNFLFGISSFLLIFILVDLFENLDKFLDKGLNKQIILYYYIYSIPEILKLIIPVGMLLSSLFTISRFTNFSEMIAMNSSGISLYRYLLPILLFGIIVTGFSIYFNGWIVPESNSQKFKIDRDFLDKNKIIGNIQNLYIQDLPNRIVRIDNYNEANLVSNNISIQIFKGNDFNFLEKRYDVKQMNWDSVRNDWKLSNIIIRTFDSTKIQNYEKVANAYSLEILNGKKINLSPSQILRKQLKPDELILSDIKEFITELETSGQDVAKAKVDYYSKISFPFASLVTILFGASLSSNRRKGGVALQFGISIFVSFIYLGFVKISQVFGYNGDIPPLLTAWLANIIFLTFAVFNLIRINR